MTIPNKSNLAEGNRAFRTGELSEAIRHYVQVIMDTPDLGKIVSGNLALARQKYRASRQGLERQHVAVCGWELAHNAAQRVYGLAKLYESFAEVEIIGSIFPQWGREIWEPIRNSNIAIHSFVVEDENLFIEQAVKLVVEHPCDIVHLSTPRIPNIFVGILYKLIWDAKVLMDIAEETLTFEDEVTAISVEDYLEQHGRLPELKDLCGKDWSRVAFGLVREFDGITMSNYELQKKYGGEVIFKEGETNKSSDNFINIKKNLTSNNSTNNFSETLLRFIRQVNFAFLKVFVNSNYLITNFKNKKDNSNNVSLNQLLTQTDVKNEAEYSSTKVGKNNKQNIKIAVVAHYYYQDIWQGISQRLKSIQKPFDLFVTVPVDKNEVACKDVIADFPNARLVIGPNLGMDIVPFLSLIPILMNEGYIAVCKIHTKKGDGDLGDTWRDLMLDSLIGSTNNFSLAIESFINNQDIALIGPASLYQSGPRLVYDNEKNLHFLCEKILRCEFPVKEWGFFAGTMFWARPKDLIEISNCINYSCWSESLEYKKDGKLEHALERFFGLMMAIKRKQVGMLHFMNTRANNCCISIVNASECTGKADISRLMKRYRQLEENHTLIKESQLFDNVSYLQRYPKLASTKADLITHYLTQGTFEGVMPNKYFSPSEYRALNQDVVRENIEPFVHYLKSGAKENRRYRKDIKLEKDQFPCFRLMALSANLINWRKCAQEPRKSNEVSIIIPVYGQPNLLKKCINSIYSSKNSIKYEIILVDNRHDDETSYILEKIADRRQNVRVVKNSENLNFALGCNVGFSVSKAEYCVFLNSDTTVTDYWLDHLIKPLENKAVAAVQPKLIFPDNTIQCCGVVFSQWSCLGYPIYSGLDAQDPIVNYGRSFKAVTAACIALRAVDFARINGFDPIFINGQEDVDLCLRLIGNSTSSCWYEPKSVVYHHEGKSTGRGRYIIHNRRQFVARWKGVTIPDDINYYNNDGYAVQHWEVDNVGFMAEGVQIYRPVIKKQNIPSSLCSNKNNTHFFKEYDFESWKNSDFRLDSYINGEISRDPNKINVLLCSHAAGGQLFGGERSFIDLLYALKLARINVYVTIPSASNAEYLRNIIRNCCGVFYFKYFHWGRGRNPCRDAVTRFKFIIDSCNISFVHANTIMLREPLLAAKERGTPCAIHVREIIQDDDHLVEAIGVPSDVIVEIVNSECDIVIANSDFTARYFARSNNIKVAKNVINIDEFDVENEVSDGIVKFGLISSNLPKKGIEDFYELAKKCDGFIKNAHFYLIGPLAETHTSRVQQLKSECEKNGYPANITFVDYKETPIEAVSLVNVVLNLSHFSESFGRTICEAQAARRPVIVYNKGALSELVEHKFNGYIAEYLNLDQIVGFVAELCSQTSLVNVLGENARKFVSTNFSHKRLSDELVAIYNETILDKTLNNPLGTASELAWQIYTQASSFADFSGLFTVRPVSIVIPVYNAFEEFKNCVESVLKYTNFIGVELIVIDDSSTDFRVNNYIQSIKNDHNIKFIRNEFNLGYTKTVNLGIELADNRDVILLNSDTVVTPAWLIGLKAAAYAYPQAGTITAMSDNAGSFSFPRPGIANPLPKNISQAKYAENIVLGCIELTPAELPTGNGFCIYLRRELINTIGSFDEVKFPRGYGEENEFCMRALAAGFKNYLTPWSFVFHVKTASFKGEREKLIKDGYSKLIECYPNYDELVRSAFSSEHIHAIREKIGSISAGFQVD